MFRSAKQLVSKNRDVVSASCVKAGMLGLEAWPRGQKTWPRPRPRPRPRGLWPRPRPRGFWPRPRGFWPRASRTLEASRNGTECDWK